MFGTEIVVSDLNLVVAMATQLAEPHVRSFFLEPAKIVTRGRLTFDDDFLSCDLSVCRTQPRFRRKMFPGSP